MWLILSLIPLLGMSLAAETAPTTGLDPKKPIYIGDIFYPPTMAFMAWQPEHGDWTVVDVERHPLDTSPSWCDTATDITEGPVSVNGVSGLKLHDYFNEQAYLSRDGERFADCFITPESTRIGDCVGLKNQGRENAHKFHGLGMRKWSCWIKGDQLGKQGV